MRELELIDLGLGDRRRLPHVLGHGTMKSVRCSSREGSCGSGFANTNAQDHGFNEGSNATVEIRPARVGGENASGSERLHVGAWFGRKEYDMKLTASQVERAANQLDARPIPENSRMSPELKRVFGDHSFFLTSSGLHFIEPAEADDATPATGRLVKIASWTNTEHNELAPHEPEVTDAIVELQEQR